MSRTSSSKMELPAPEIRARILRFLEKMQSQGQIFGSPTVSAKSSPTAVKSLPAWVQCYGLLLEEKNAWLWCEVEPGATDTFPSQAVINLPPGQYLVDALSASSYSCISRESAMGNPLVVGLPFEGSALVLWIRRIG